MWYCYVTELQAYAFVKKDFIIKKGHDLCQTLYIRDASVFDPLHELFRKKEGNVSLLSFNYFKIPIIRMS